VAVLTTAANDWLRHHDARLGAALAYYSVFSMGPLLLIVVSIAGLFFGGDAVREALTGQFRSLLGPTGSQAVEAMLKGASSPSSGILSAVIGIVLLLVAALGVVVQLKDALNTIWETKEPESVGVWWYLRTYLTSFAGILGLGFLLAVSLVISTALAAVSSWLGGGESLFWQLVNFAVSLAMFSTLFAMLFKWFADAAVSWRNALLGGLTTALLFNVGKLAIGWYIGTQGLRQLCKCHNGPHQPGGEEHHDEACDRWSAPLSVRRVRVRMLNHSAGISSLQRAPSGASS
jgi:membrane protein